MNILFPTHCKEKVLEGEVGELFDSPRSYYYKEYREMPLRKPILCEFILKPIGNDIFSIELDDLYKYLDGVFADINKKLIVKSLT